MTDMLSQHDLEAIKGKQQATWASGDYALIGATLQIVGESLCEAVDLSAGSRVLDVAAGNGNATLAAARRGCDVTASDYVEELLEAAQRRADANGMSITTRFADAENLPFADDEFDAVVSTFGVMFVPDAAKAAAEMVRVCRSGGRVGLANWTPAGFRGGHHRLHAAANGAPRRRAIGLLAHRDREHGGCAHPPGRGGRATRLEPARCGLRPRVLDPGAPAGQPGLNGTHRP